MASNPPTPPSPFIPITPTTTPGPGRGLTPFVPKPIQPVQPAAPLLTPARPGKIKTRLGAPSVGPTKRTTAPRSKGVSDEFQKRWKESVASNAPSILFARGGVEADMMGRMIAKAPEGITTFFGGLGADVKGLVWNKMLRGEEYDANTAQELWHSLGKTAGFVYDAKPGRGWGARWGDYWDALESGTPFSQFLIEDIGNITIAGGLVSQGLKRAGALASVGAEQSAARALAKGEVSPVAPKLARVGETATGAGRTVSRAMVPFNKATMLPIKPWVMGAGALGKMVREGAYLGNGYLAWGEKAAKAYREQASQTWDRMRDVDPVSDDYAVLNSQYWDLVNKARRNERFAYGWGLRRKSAAVAREAKGESGKAARAIQNQAEKPLHIGEVDPETNVTYGKLDATEQATVLAVLDGHAQLLNQLSNDFGIPLGQLTLLSRYDATPGRYVTPEAATMASRFLNNGEGMSRMQYDRLANAVKNVATEIGSQTNVKIVGAGRVNPLNPHHLIPVPIASYLRDRIARAGMIDMVDLIDSATDILELPIDDPRRMAFLQSIIEVMPEEIALDPMIYPSPMRPIVEAYRRIRRNLERGAIEEGIGTPPRGFDSGKPGAAKKVAESFKKRAAKAKAQFDKISEQIARLEEKHSLSVDKLRRLDLIEKHITEAATPEQLAGEFNMRVEDVNRILGNSRLVQAHRRMRRLYDNYLKIQERAALLGVDDLTNRQIIADELALLEDQVATIRQAYEAEVARLQQERAAIDESMNVMEEEMDNLSDDLFDAEDDFVEAGGNPEDLNAPDNTLDELGLGDEQGITALAESIAADETTLLELEAMVEYRRYLEEQINKMENPTPEEIAAAQTDRVNSSVAAIDELNTEAEQFLGGGYNANESGIKFYVTPIPGNSMWEWWYRLDPKIRRRWAMQYFRGSKYMRTLGTRGSKTAKTQLPGAGLDQMADPLGLSPEEWGDKFIDWANRMDEAKRELRDARAEDMTREEVVALDQDLAQAYNELYDLVKEQGLDDYSIAAIEMARQMVDGTYRPRPQEGTLVSPETPATQPGVVPSKTTTAKADAESIVDEIDVSFYVSFDGKKYSSKKAIQKGYERPPDSIAQINFSIGEGSPISAVASIPIYENTTPADIYKAANQILVGLEKVSGAMAASEGIVRSNIPQNNDAGQTSSYLNFQGDMKTQPGATRFVLEKAQNAFNEIRNKAVQRIGAQPSAGVGLATPTPRLEAPTAAVRKPQDVIDVVRASAGPTITATYEDGNYIIVSGEPSTPGRNPNRIEMKVYTSFGYVGEEFKPYFENNDLVIRAIDMVLDEIEQSVKRVGSKSKDYEYLNVEFADVVDEAEFTPQLREQSRKWVPSSTPQIIYTIVMNTGGFKKSNISVSEFVDALTTLRDQLAGESTLLPSPVSPPEPTPAPRLAAPAKSPTARPEIPARVANTIQELGVVRDKLEQIERELVSLREERDNTTSTTNKDELDDRIGDLWEKRDDAREEFSSIGEKLSDDDFELLRGELYKTIKDAIPEIQTLMPDGFVFDVEPNEYSFTDFKITSKSEAKQVVGKAYEFGFTADQQSVIDYTDTSSLEQYWTPSLLVDAVDVALDYINKSENISGVASMRFDLSDIVTDATVDFSDARSVVYVKVSGAKSNKQKAEIAKFKEALLAFRGWLEGLDRGAAPARGGRLAPTRVPPVPDPTITDPVAQKAVYESEVTRYLLAEELAAYEAAQTVKEKLEALDDLLIAAEKNRAAYKRFIEQFNRHKQSRVNLLSLPAQIAARKGMLQPLQEKIDENSAIANAILNSEQMRLLNAMPANYPLDIAMNLGDQYPSSLIPIEMPDGSTMRPIGPGYVPGGMRTRSFGGGALGSYVDIEGMTGFQKASSEKMRTGDRQNIFNMAELAERMAEEGGSVVQNFSWRILVGQYGKNAAAVLGDDVVAKLREEAILEAENLNSEGHYALVGEIPPDDFIPGIGAGAPGTRNPAWLLEAAKAQLFGEKVADYMKSRGYEPVDPFRKPDSKFRGYQIGEETMFVPDYVVENVAQIEARLNPENLNGIMRLATTINKIWKGSTLAFSIMWQIGDLTTAMILARMTGVPFKTMIERMKQVQSESYTTLRSTFDPRVDVGVGPYTEVAFSSPVQDVSVSTAERAFLRNLPPLIGKKTMLQRLGRPGEALQSFADRSFKFNETINRITRHAFFLEKLDGVLKELGTDLDTVVADGSWKTNSRIREAVNEAAISANKWLGDFADLSARERRYISLVFPFYAWTKHIHKVFYALGKEHPQSLTWYMYMGTLGADTEGDPFDLRMGTIPVFGGAASTNFLNPLGDVVEGPIGSFLLRGDPRKIGSMTGPVIRTPAAALGIDLARLDRLSRPAGTGMYTKTGMPQPGLFNPTDPSTYGPVLGYGIQQFPIATRLLNLGPVGGEIPGTNIATGPVLRYATGEARTIPGTDRPRLQPGGRAAALGRLVSFPFIPSRSDEQIQDVYRSAKIRLKSLEKLKKRAEKND